MKVVIADDHETIRVAIREMLEMREGFDVVGEASNGKQAVELVARTRPDVVVMDLKMPVMDGVQATEAITRDHPEVAVLAFTSATSLTPVAEALRAGAIGYVLKSDPGDFLIEAIECASRGEPVRSPEPII